MSQSLKGSPTKFQYLDTSALFDWSYQEIPKFGTLLPIFGEALPCAMRFAVCELAYHHRRIVYALGDQLHNHQ